MRFTWNARVSDASGKKRSTWPGTTTGQQTPTASQQILVPQGIAPASRAFCKLVCDRIIGILTPIELGLFSKKIHVLDKKIQPGFTKLFWMFKISSNTFVKDCLIHVSKVTVR